VNKVQLMTFRLAQSCDGNPIFTTVLVMLFFVMFNVLEATAESLIFGAPFKHFLDVIFQLAFIGYAAYAVYWCAVFNIEKQKLFAVVEEREACAKVCESFYNHEAKDCAEAIRARSNAKVSGAGTASAGLPGYAAGGNGERK